MSQSAVFNLRLPERQTLADGISQSLRDAIFGGFFQAGQRLAEGKLATSLGVSRAPVREALALLEQEGLVSRTPGGGTTVTSLSRTDVEEICSLRLQLESLAIQLGVTRSNEAQWAELADNIRDTQETTDPQSLAEKDLQFHEKLVRAAGHGRLLASWLTLRSQLRLIMVQRNLADEDSRRATVEGHKDLLRAIRACDAERAVSILRHHLQRQFTWMINSFDVMDRT